MPTVIDALIVTLDLDPKNFSDGQRRATETLRRMEQDAGKSARNIGESGSKGLAVFFAGIDKNFAETNRHLTQIATQTRRTGRSIADSGREGAAGLTNLTTAALSAFSAMKALQGLYHEVTKTAASGAAIGRITPETGSRSGWIQQFANAAGFSVNANPAAVMEDMRSLEMDLQTFAKRGEMSGRLREMSIGGIAVSQSDTAESLMRKVEGNLAGKSSQAEAAMWADRYGLSRDTGRFARQGSQAVDTAMAQVRDRNLTEEQIRQLDRLQSAENKVSQAYTHLWQTITADLSRSGLAAALEGMSSFLDNLSHNEVELRAVEIGIGLVATATGVTMVSAIAKLVISLNALWALPAWRALVGMAGLAGGGAGLAVGAFGAGMTLFSGTAGNQAEIDAEKRLGAQARAAAGGGNAAAGGDEGFASGPLGAVQRAIYEIESGGGRRYNNSPYAGHSATGPMQIIPSTFAANALPGERIDNPADNMRVGLRLIAKLYKQYGGDLDKVAYSYANGSPSAPNYNGDYVGKMRRLIGAHPEWMKTGGGASPLPSPQDEAEVERRMDAGAPPAWTGDEARQRWEDWVHGTNNVRAGSAQARAGVASTATNNNDNSRTTNIGDVTVHTMATDGPGVVRAFQDARRRTMANQVNTGLE